MQVYPVYDNDNRRDLMKMRQFKTLALRSSATLALLGALSFTAQAQVVITEDTDQMLFLAMTRILKR